MSIREWVKSKLSTDALRILFIYHSLRAISIESVKQLANYLRKNPFYAFMRLSVSLYLSWNMLYPISSSIFSKITRT